MPAPQLFCKVAIPVPLGQAFSYGVPRDLRTSACRGARVLCDFGRRRVLGVVLEQTQVLEGVEVSQVRPILAVVGAEPAVPNELLSFLQQVARYYLAPIGEVIELALPTLGRDQTALLKQKGLLDEAPAKTVGKLVQFAVPRPAARLEQAPGGQARGVLADLLERGAQPVAQLTERFKSARAAVKRLEGLGLLQIEQRPADNTTGNHYDALPERDVAPGLNPAQSAAVAAILACLTERKRAAFLLEGVTASGKTEVYLHAVEHCLKQGRGAIVLVPEIALTPQLVARFRARLGNTIAVLHSGLTRSARHRMWCALRSGELKVAVGARSALFAPVVDLALICVDEEHDGSFKQEEGVRYHARDMALLRTHLVNAVCVLGSATPSVGTVALVEEGKLQRLRLPARANANATLPEVTITDLRRMGPGPTQERLLSLALHRELEATLHAGEQAILFLNRRGFAPSLICADCGQIFVCPNCSVALTLHRGRGEQLRCHYCDFQRRLPESCDSCKSKALLQEGAGTERIEACLKEAFPTARIARLDRDVAAGAKSERILSRMRRGDIDILVGTQMVTKGHDLPSVTLVGVLNADAALSMPDFRAAERSFQLLVQVAGRAGRAGRKGRVLIQTRKPDHPAITLAARHDVAGFIQQEMRDRKELGYPPFGRLALVRLDSLDERAAKLAAERLAAEARRVAPPDLVVLGPAPAPLARLRSRYRFHFLLRAPERAPLRKALLSIRRSAVDRRVRLAIDIDPVSML